MGETPAVDASRDSHSPANPIPLSYTGVGMPVTIWKRRRFGRGRLEARGPRNAFRPGCADVSSALFADRGREGIRLPSLRTVRAVLPHTALQSPVSSSGVSCGFPGCFQGEQPLGRKVGIWPLSLVVGIGAPPRTMLPFAQDCPQSAAHEAVDRFEGTGPGVLEVAEPALQHRR